MGKSNIGFQIVVTQEDTELVEGKEFEIGLVSPNGRGYIRLQRYRRKQTAVKTAEAIRELLRKGIDCEVTFEDQR
jgi:hypothetical protein